MRTYARLGDVEGVIQLRDMLLAANLQPTILFYNSLLEATFISGDFKQALK